VKGEWNWLKRKETCCKVFKHKSISFFLEALHFFKKKITFKAGKFRFLDVMPRGLIQKYQQFGEISLIPFSRYFLWNFVTYEPQAISGIT